jgi:hypothetical protein
MRSSLSTFATSVASDLTATAVMRVDGDLAVYLTGVIDGGSTLEVTGGTFVTGTACDKTANALVSGTTTRFACTDDTAALLMGGLVRPNAGVSSMVISYYQKAAVVSTGGEAEAVAVLVAAAVADLGTLTGKITVDVIAVDAFSDFTTLTACSVTDSAGAATTTGHKVTSVTVPSGSTMTIKGSTATSVLTASNGLLITSATNTITNSGQSVPLTTMNSSFATMTAGAVGSYTLALRAGNGTATTDTISVTVVASCTLGTFSLANSFVQLKSTYGAATTLVDVVPGTINAGTLHLTTRLRNAYGTALSSGTWVATATGGAVVGISLTDAAGTPTAASVAATVGTGDYVNVAVSQGANLENKPWAGTITISYNGTTLVTKNAAITGDIATVALSSPVIAKTGGNTFRTFVSNAYDSAGNRVAATLLPVSTTLGSVVQNLIFTNPTLATGDQTTGNGVTCGATAGSAVVQAQTTNAAGATILSNTWTQICAGGIASYKASMDKAAYNPGEVAVLTIEGLDSKGNRVFGPGALVAADAAVTADRANALGTGVSIAGSYLTPVTAALAADVFVNGVATYRFVVGATAGSFSVAVNLPAVTTGTAQTVAYKINSDGSVSNADVLKSIVALIASINKQIQALQKLILKR